jgi:hypothetical protein
MLLSKYSGTLHMKRDKGARKSVAFNLKPQEQLIAARPHRPGSTRNMEKKLYEGFTSDEVTDEMLVEASKLFSDHYGVWGERAAQSMGKFAIAGRLGDTNLYKRS